MPRHLNPRLHVLSEIDREAQQAICRHCGPVRIVRLTGRFPRCVVARDQENRKSWRNPKYAAARKAAMDRYCATDHGKRVRARTRLLRRWRTALQLIQAFASA